MVNQQIILHNVRQQMAKRKHNLGDLARSLKKPQHQVETLFQPGHQLTLRQVMQFEDYCDRTLLAVLSEPEQYRPWLKFTKDDNDLPF